MMRSFFVPGIPAPGGSKKFVGFAKKTGRAVLVDDAGEKNKNWRTSCAQVAREATGGEIMSGPLCVSFTFLMPRPKGHYTSNGALRKTAPAYPTTRPDVLKLARSTEDALTGVVWADDSQTINLHAYKCFATGSSGCQVRIEEIKQ